MSFFYFHYSGFLYTLTSVTFLRVGVKGWSFLCRSDISVCVLYYSGSPTSAMPSADPRTSKSLMCFAFSHPWPKCILVCKVSFIYILEMFHRSKTDWFTCGDVYFYNNFARVKVVPIKACPLDVCVVLLYSQSFTNAVAIFTEITNTENI